MTSLQQILAAYRTTSQTEREKGSYFEELIRTYFRHEPSYADLYSDVWHYADWAREIGTPQFGHSGKDTGIDLVAKTRGTDEFHAIQCKCYAEDHRVQKKDIDSFFTASGQAPFTHRVIVTTTNDWSENAENSLVGQTPPVTRIDLHDLDNSRIDWAKYQPSQPPALKKKNDMRKHQASAKTYAHFRAYEKAGRELAHWHLNYETVACCPEAVVEEAASASAATGLSAVVSTKADDRRYRVTKMKFAKRKDADTGKSVADKTTVHYNEFITIKNIPLGAYDYIVNGKPALEWVMERQSVTTDKGSGITNDANLWATETMQNPKYPLELFLRVITVSLETNKIVADLPGLEITIESTS